MRVPSVLSLESLQLPCTARGLLCGPRPLSTGWATVDCMPGAGHTQGTW